MKNATVLIALLLAFPFKSYALTCDDLNAENMEQVLDMAWKMGIESHGAGAVEAVCDDDEKMLNLKVSEGSLSAKEVAAFRKILNKPKTTDELPQARDHYKESDKIDQSYPCTMNYVLECIKRPGPGGVASCPGFVGLLRGDKQFKKLYQQYWLKTRRKKTNFFEMGDSGVVVVNYRGKKYLYFSEWCKSDCEKNGVARSMMLYDISDQRIIGIYTLVNYRPHSKDDIYIAGPYNRNEKELFAKWGAKYGSTTPTEIENAQSGVGVVNIK